MEAKAALECVSKVWAHSEILAFIDIICLNNDAMTKAYLHHSYANLDTLLMPRPKNKKGEPKRSKKDNKGQLPRNHPAINFLADLCHGVYTFGKYLYLWALLKGGKKKSEINVVDCLRRREMMPGGFSLAKNLPTTNSKNQLKAASFTTSIATPPVGVGANTQRRVSWN
jgi:hypothetical protein